MRRFAATKNCLCRQNVSLAPVAKINCNLLDQFRINESRPQLSRGKWKPVERKIQARWWKHFTILPVHDGSLNVSPAL